MSTQPPNPDFDIVQTVEDWDNHEPAKHLARLDATRGTARERDLKRSARRFRPPKHLLNAINAALAAQVPMLLTGDPGTGKTQVAWFLAEYFAIQLFEYQVRSESTARDLRYDFDAVAYLRDAYLAGLGRKQGGGVETHNEDAGPGTDPRSHPRYLKPGPLWEAYQHPLECVVLIDEIDKAPRDFPNDLLQELDQYRFAHPFDPGRFIERDRDLPPPLVVLTSNGERRLPDAFLRRCVIYHIELDDDLLEDILNAWKGQFPNLTRDTREAALARFKEIRAIKRLSRRPGVAELLIWLTVLAAQGVQTTDLDPPLDGLPALSCLIKDHEDYPHL